MLIYEYMAKKIEEYLREIGEYDEPKAVIAPATEEPQPQPQQK